MISKMKAQQFEQINDTKWKEIASESLRGVSFDQLGTKTIEGIELQPLYTRELVEKELGQRQAQLLQSIRSGQRSNDWIVAQRPYCTSGEQYVHKVEQFINRGNEAIVYDGNNRMEWQEANLQRLAKLAETFPVYAYNVAKDDPFLQLFDRVPKHKRKKIEGAVTGEGELPKDYLLIRDSGADTISYHAQGADAVTELAIALAIAAEKSISYRSFKQFESKFFVRFAIDTHFFIEIAKLRAFRVLWQSFAHAYNYKQPSRVPIVSETSLRTYSKLDEYVNLLRAANEAFSAVLGGTDLLTVHPHNVIAQVSDAAERHARNIQLIIKEETFVEHVVDPAGGSYYIDILTNELVDQAWKLFLQIENEGGFNAFVESGALEDRINQAHNQRKDYFATRKFSLIGTNTYADLTNKIVAEETYSYPQRYATVYEQLRQKFIHNQPSTVLLTFGELKDFKKRADFVEEFLATGGIKVTYSPSFKTIEEANTWIAQNPFDYGIVCVHEKEVVEIMDQWIHTFPKDRWIDVAGKYDIKKAKSWQKAGVHSFIYNGQDQLQKFAEIKQRWKGDGKDEKA